MQPVLCGQDWVVFFFEMSRNILESILYFEYVMYGCDKTLRQHQKRVYREEKQRPFPKF